MNGQSSLLAIVGRTLDVGTTLAHVLQRSQKSTTVVPDSNENGAATEELQTWSKELQDIFTQLDNITADPDQAKLHFACKTLVSDICLRLDLTAKESPEYAHKAWSNESVTALLDRLSWLRDELQKGVNGQASDVSRILWTGPGQQQERRSSTALSYREQNRLLPVRQSRQIDPELQLAVERSLENADKTELLQETFLESLAFSSMSDREEEVSAAHRRTFEWILASDRDPDPAGGRAMAQHEFVPWLQRSDRGQMYWINGKAGSGKSTLLRFIAQHQRTTSCLREWAGDTPLIVANFYFWTGGSVLQRSHMGLLRSLLHQLLQHRPDLTAWAFPALWLVCQDTKKRVSALKSWEHATLLEGFYNVLESASRTARICLFIDGLDEFDGREDAVIELVREIVDRSPNIKVCVSSRPWPAFEKAFQNVPQILLQELTGKDIEQYVTDQLKQNTATRDVVAQLPDAELQRLRHIVLGQANGVFLWASLALQRVTHAAQANNTVEALGEALLALPSDLNDLFRHLLFHLRSEEALRDQSQILQILRARDAVCDFTGDDSVRSISLYQTSLALYGDLASTDLPIQQCDQDEVLKQCESFATVLEDRCAGLIVLSSQDKIQARTRSRFLDKSHMEVAANRRVHYLHRTVRDFFAYSGVWTDIVKHSNSSDFDPHLSLLKSHVLRLRAPLQEPEQHRRLDEWWHDDIVLAMTHARFASPTTVKSQTVLLDGLNNTLGSYWRRRGNDPLDTWARHAFSSYEERNKHQTPFHHAFLSLTAKFGLAEYLRSKLASSGEFGYQAGLPLLTHALEFLISRRQTVYPLSSPDVVSVILAYGEDPNQQYKTLAARDETPWLLAVKNVREGKRRGWIGPFDIDPEGTRRWTEVLGVLLGAQADPQAVISKDKWDDEVAVCEVIEDVAEAYFAADVWRLNTRLRDL